jgi:hypothetical protein
LDGIPVPEFLVDGTGSSDGLVRLAMDAMDASELGDEAALRAAEAEIDEAVNREVGFCEKKDGGQLHA